MRKNILVTGGCGFIGSAMCRHLTQSDSIRVVNLDALRYSANPESVAGCAESGRYTFVEGDICDQALVLSTLRKHDIDAILHFAAESHVDRSISGPEAFITTNVAGTCSMLQASRNWMAEMDDAKRETFRFLHVSTDEVYGDLGPEDPAFSETTPYAPSSPYSASKASSDHMVRAWGRTFGIPYLITNCSNNYGSHQFPEKLIPLMIISAIKGMPLPVYGNGQNIRDWLHVDDHVSALMRVLEAGEPGETYNIGGNSELRNIDIVQMICDILDAKSPRSDGLSYREQISFVADRPGHDLRYAIDAGKIRDQLGWEPSRDFSRGLVQTVEWYLGNSAWWAPLWERNKT